MTPAIAAPVELMRGSEEKVIGSTPFGMHAAGILRER
jgi:hypothetical protein